MLLWFLLQIFVFLFNKTSFIDKRIYFEVGERYQLELNVSNINVVEFPSNNNECTTLSNKFPKKLYMK